MFALRAYARTPLRGRTRLTRWLHRWLCPQGSACVVTLTLDGVSIDLDVAEQSQASMFYGFYEPNEIEFLRRTLRPAQVFVDAGANVGYYTAVAAGIVGRSGVVHAFEPVPWLYGRLQHLAEQARASGFQIHAHQAALADTRGQTTIWVSRTSNIGWSTIVPGLMDAAEVKECYEVPCLRLDEHFRRAHRRPPTMVKIDVEGAEVVVLRGMAGLFEAGQRPIVLCEVTERTVREATALLSRYHYDPFRCMRGGKIVPLTLPLPFSVMTCAFVPRGA